MSFFIASLSLPDLQKPFKIEIDASEYAIVIVLTEHGNLVAYHNKTLNGMVCRCLTYNETLHSFFQTYKQ